MKKLMIAAAIVCAAAMVQASSFQWKSATQNGVIYNGAGDSAEKLTSGIAYIFDAATVSQATLVTAFAGESFDITKMGALDSGEVSSGGKLTTHTAVAYGSGDTYNMYFAIVNADKLYISDVKEYKSTAAESTATLQFKPQSEGNSKNTIGQASAGYTTAGWYTAVPEPTSGLLLLLGVAGLALRRRRA